MLTDLAVFVSSWGGASSGAVFVSSWGGASSGAVFVSSWIEASSRAAIAVLAGAARRPR
ncbi:hypothetical protein [Streptosporangium roseum]|uniref:hypothetical protein n=1 Tax=Streptosporangium roseum TaxID=2001 RepID=UPI003421A564